MFSTSPTTAALDAALAKAQGEVQTAVKDKQNPAFRSRYADLASVWEACRAVVSKHGISVTQWPVSSEDGRVHLITRVAHAGEWMQAEFAIPAHKQDAHGYASACTYLKRIGLTAAIGVVADDDDDGNGPVRNVAAAAPAAPYDHAKALATIVESMSLDALRDAYVEAQRTAKAGGATNKLPELVAAKDKRKADLEAGK